MVKIGRLLDVNKEYEIGDELLLKIIPFFSLEVLSKVSSSLSCDEKNDLKRYVKVSDPIKLEEINEVMIKRMHIHLYRTISSIKTFGSYNTAKEHSKYEKMPLSLLIPTYLAMADRYEKELASTKNEILIFKK